MYDSLLAIVMTVIIIVIELYIVQSYIIHNSLRTYVYSDAGVFMTLSRTKELQ